MNILFDYQIFRMQQYGGISRYFYEIANRIAAVPGNKVEIFAPFYITEYFRNNNRVRPWGIKISPLSRPKLRYIVDVVNSELSRLLVKPRNNVEVFHETYYSLADYCPLSAKRIITVYDMIHEKFADYFSDAAEVKQIKAHAVRRADHVICISENTKQDLIQFLAVPEERISVVYLGSSLTSNTSNAEEKANTPAANWKPYILYVGARSGYKNFERLLRAYAGSSLLRREFTLVCFGWVEFLPCELELMRLLNISTDSVKHISGTDEVLAGLYDSAAAFVYPSLYEGFGIPLLEAMSLGCPVACANSGSMPEVAGDAAELFDPYDESAIRAAIERVVLVPEYTAALIERGRRRAVLFSWEKCAKDTIGVYQQVLEG
jgi:glycosyltransferase involved in cell wall biosynthesis